MICVEPSELTDVIDSRPAIVENWFSSGVATDAPIVSGLAPGSCAVTSSVGKSTFGRSLTGSERYATDAEQRDGRHEQAGRDRPLDESFRNIHCHQP